jgi:hypothetical protein
MSHKTYCDRCRAECKFRTGRLHMEEMHARASGEMVSSDDYKPFDLCGECIDAVRAFLGDMLIIQHYEPDSVAVGYPPDRAPHP